MGDGKGLRIMVPGFFSNTSKKQNTCPTEVKRNTRMGDGKG